MHHLAWWLKHSNPDTSILIENSALVLAKKIQWLQGEADVYRGLGVINRIQGNLHDALGYLNKAVQINVELENVKGASANLSGIGNIYLVQGDYPRALECYFRALEMVQQSQLTGDNTRVGSGERLISTIYGNIGLVYHGQGDLSMALKHYVKAREQAEINGQQSSIIRHTGDIGGVYDDWGDSALASGDSSLAMSIYYPKALSHYFKALEQAEELGHNDLVSVMLGNIGLVYYDQAIYSDAEQYFFKALKMAEKLGNKGGIARHSSNIGLMLTDTENYTEAEEYLLKSLNIFREMGALEDQMQTEEMLSHLYNVTRNYKSALEHYKKYSAAKDSLFNEAKSKDIGKLEAKHEFETAEAERKRAEEEQAKQAASTKSRRDNLQYSGILIFMVLVFAGVFMLGRFSIPIRLAEGMIFFAFLLFFEFMLVMLDPYIESYSGGEPAYKLLFNAVLAGLIFPLHSLFETKLKKRLVR